LWYIGGFIIKSLAEKLLRSKHALKEEMMLTVLEFREDPDAPIAENETTLYSGLKPLIVVDLPDVLTSFTHSFMK
jgi:hypothetical protein